MQYEVLRKENDYLSEIIGRTYNRKTLRHIDSFYKDRFGKFSARSLNKFSLVTCLEPSKRYQEILSLGGSSLLRHKKTGIVECNLILDNFGLWFASLFQAVGSPQNITTVTNDTGVTQTTYNYGYNSFPPWNYAGAFSVGTVIRMGSGTNAPARCDFKIQTALANAPESGYLNTNNGAYTAGNTIVYQADANPTGGAGTVNEIGSFGAWYPDATKKVMLAHDLINPSVNYAVNKLLRGSYTWSI